MFFFVVFNCILGMGLCVGVLCLRAVRGRFAGFRLLVRFASWRVGLAVRPGSWRVGLVVRVGGFGGTGFSAVLGLGLFFVVLGVFLEKNGFLAVTWRFPRRYGRG